MRLNRLDLTRYGKFTDAVLDFGPAQPGSPDLHIVYGLNEAGKSTAFAAYLDLLFGIPAKSNYNFLHDYANMQVGGVLEFDGAEHTFQRVKRNSNTLLDGRGQPVNEALLSAALGGISREAYRTMFSLDDQSLKDGGAAIMESKGDLGELLFSASAGLADVSRILLGVQSQAEQIHKRRARNSELAQRKQMLTALKDKRAAIDTQASAFANLVQTVTQAEKSYHATERELSEARARQVALARILSALPAAQELKRLSDRRSIFAGLPHPSRDLLALLPQLLRDETRLQTQGEGLAQRRDRLMAASETLDSDETILALGPRIAALAEGRARDKTAETDLPRRRTALAEQDASIALTLKALGREGETDPTSLLLPAPVISALRDLIEQKSGIDTRLATSRREMQRIADGLGTLEEAGAPALIDPAVPASTRRDIERLSAIADQLRRSDRPARLAVEERSVAKIRQKAEIALSQLAIGPVEPDTLRAMPCPDRRQLESWRASAAEATKRRANHADTIRTLETRILDREARITLLKRGSDTIDDQSAASARATRDALWQTHRAELTAETAAPFEEAMQRDDRITEARLARSADLATLRELENALTLDRASLEREKALAEDAGQTLARLAETVARAIPQALAAMPDEALEDQLFRIARFADQRTDCLGILDELEQAKDRVAELRAEIAAGLADLSAALQRHGKSPGPGTPADALFAEADRIVAESEARENASLTLEKRRQDLTAEAAQRKRDLADAEQAATAWQDNWTATLGETWFSRETSPVRVRATLDALTDLPGLLRERDQLSNRIRLMELDQHEFAEEIATLYAALGEPMPTGGVRAADAALTQRHQQALRASDQQTARQAEIQALDAEREKLEQEQALHRASRQRLLSALEADTLEEASLMLERLTERDQLEQRITSLEAQLVADLRVSTHTEALAVLEAVDAAEAEQEQLTLSDRIERLDAHVRELFGALTLARSKLEAVGGDNAVAAIEAERATLILDIEDCAMTYLKLRTGYLAASSALELYREKHRSSMMQRASEAFRQITRGDYSGLAARQEKDREILIGLPRDGGSRLSDAMSTGTRTQLYLALRLAGYEEFAKIRPPVPFVADDIMETFDEPRSEEVFRLFGDMAGMGQVIYLTHHRHLCDIAQAVVPGVKIHAL